MNTEEERVLQTTDRPMVIIRINKENRLIVSDINTGFAEMSGFSHEELIDQPLSILEAPEGTFPESKIRTAMINSLGGRYVFEARRPGDIPYQQNVTVVPRAHPDGEYREAMVYASDYTRWKLWRPARRHHITGARDEYFFRLYLSRMVRRANQLEQSFGLVEINVYEDGLDDDAEKCELRDVYEPLVKHVESVAHEEDVLAHNNETTLVLIRPDVQPVDQSFDDLGRLIGFELKRDVPVREKLSQLEADVTWSTYPPANTPFRMLGYELSDEVA